MEITEDMLQMAMKKATEHGLIPRRQSPDLYMQNQAALEDILRAALQADACNHTSATVAVLTKLKTGIRSKSSDQPPTNPPTPVISDNVVDMYTRRQYLLQNDRDFA